MFLWFFLGSYRRGISLGLIFLYFWGKIFLNTLLNPPWIVNFSNWIVGKGTIAHPMWYLVTFPSNMFAFFFPQNWVVSFHACNHQYSLEYSKETIFRSLGFSLCMHACMLSHFSCVRLCDPVDCSPSDSSVHGILQVRILEWVGLPFPSPGDLPDPVIELMSLYVSCFGRCILYH